MYGSQYHCPYCGIKFDSNIELLVHEVAHQEYREGTFPCSVCNKSFYTSQKREEHKKCHFSPEEFQCTVCFKTFTNLKYLQNHCVVHSKEKRHKCELCDKQFFRKQEFNNHKRIHTGEQPFECEECKRRFSQRSNLLTHIRTVHENEKRHQCTKCSKAFKRRRLLEYHIFAKHTTEKPLNCTYCGKGFNYPHNLKDHKLNCKLRLTEFFLMTTVDDKHYIVQRIDNNYYIVNPDTRLPTQMIKFRTNLEQQSSAKIQTDDQELNKELSSDSQQSSERFVVVSNNIHSEPNVGACSRIDASHFPSCESKDVGTECVDDMFLPPLSGKETNL